MKPWQHGYALDELRALRQLFNRYEPFSFGRFAIPDEAQIALALHQQEAALLYADGKPAGMMIGKIAQRDSIRRDFVGRGFRVKQGDFCIDHLTYVGDLPPSVVQEYLLIYAGNRSIWATIHAEDRDRIRLMEHLGFVVVGSKIAAGSEIYSILLRSNRPAIRLPEPLDPAHRPSLAQLSPAWITPGEVASIISEIETSQAEWADHYSSYNLRKSWSAISLRGFSDDPSFIIKPAEMSRKWKAENPGMLAAEVRDTAMFNRFPTIRQLCSESGSRFQRIRLMRVRAGDGALSRHADIIDREAGPLPGQISRLHIPIISDPCCRFTAWNLSGEMLSHHLSPGSLWYLDTRKPHAVSNEGSTSDRIHLVLDAISDPILREAIARAEA